MVDTLKRCWQAAFILLSVCWMNGSHAEQFKTLGRWDVHYMLMPSTLLEPAIAKQYQLQRSETQQLLNISVLDHNTQQAQAVQLTGTSSTLAGQVQTLTFQKVQEGDAIYYLAQVDARSEQVLRLQVTIEQQGEQQQLRFEQKVYPE